MNRYRYESIYNKKAIMFLNVNGVISTSRSVKQAKLYGNSCKSEYINLPKDKTKLLHKIDLGYSTRPRVIIFGGWDNKDCLNNFINKSGFWPGVVANISSLDNIEGSDDSNTDRINIYLKRLEEESGSIPDFIILGNDEDDEALKKEFDLRCILVSNHTGLTLEDVNRANYILSLTN